MLFSQGMERLPVHSVIVPANSQFFRKPSKPLIPDGRWGSFACLDVAVTLWMNKGAVTLA